jgi:hypothetical protein
MLKGMSLCLSGFKDSSQKAELHKLITELGGSYTRDLLTTTTTHLIMAENPTQATEKYHEAIRTARIEIVHYKWLEMCNSLNRIVPTHDYTISVLTSQGMSVVSMADTDEVLNRTELSSLQQLQMECRRLSQADENDSILCPLFSSCNFFFAGFSEGSLALKKLGVTADTDDSISSSTTNSFLYDLQQLVRSYMGTISWTLTGNSITHVIVHPDNCGNANTRYVQLFAHKVRLFIII